jgi:hypothetical protein
VINQRVGISRRILSDRRSSKQKILMDLGVMQRDISSGKRLKIVHSYV